MLLEQKTLTLPFVLEQKRWGDYQIIDVEGCENAGEIRGVQVEL